ncbi:MAG: PIN domain-containing protein [Actinomycetota bacterium]
MTVFVDTGVLFAAAAVRDERHERAASILRSVRGDDPFTTDHGVVETWSLLNSRFDHATAMSFWSGLRGSALSIEFVQPPDLERAHAIAGIWADQHFDIIDCTSFAVMERLACTKAASFDRDFAVYRTGVDSKIAFEIVR